MIRINVVRENSKIKKITLMGHANYQEYGRDIVCAAVSATYLCTVNAILSIDRDAILVNSNNEFQEIVIVNSNDVVIKLLENMLEMLEELEKQYPKNIRLSKEENE